MGGPDWRMVKMKLAEWAALRAASSGVPESASVSRTPWQKRDGVFITGWPICVARTLLNTAEAPPASAAGPMKVLVDALRISYRPRSVQRLALEGKSYVWSFHRRSRSPAFEDLYERRMQESISALKLR